MNNIEQAKRIGLPEYGHFLILAKSRKFKGEFCFLVDRKQNQNQWWQSQTDGAMMFTSLNSAEQTLRLYKHNSPMIVTIEEAKWIEKNYNNQNYNEAVTGLILYNNKTQLCQI